MVPSIQGAVTVFEVQYLHLETMNRDSSAVVLKLRGSIAPPFDLKVSEARSRLKATSAVLHAREKSIADLREAMRELEHDKLAAQAEAKTQSERLNEQVMHATIAPQWVCSVSRPAAP